jgi:hypothetical protein
MANTGYITSSGIQQVFTSGPYSGSVVSSSYASGSNLFGSIINLKQSFISGTIDNITPCPGTSYFRYYQDLISCPINGCSPPVLTNSYVLNCSPYTGSYVVQYNSSSVSALYTVIKYSTDPTFLTNTGSVIYTNSNPLQLPINTSTLPLQPSSYTNVYFQAYNSCSSGVTSSLSNIVSSSCEVPSGPTIEPFTINITNSSDEILYYKVEGSTQYSILGGGNTSITFNTNTYNLGFSYYRRNQFELEEKNISIIGGGFNDGDVSVTITDIVGTSGSETSNTFPFYFTFIPDGVVLTNDIEVNIDRSSFSYSGTLTLNLGSSI